MLAFGPLTPFATTVRPVTVTMAADFRERLAMFKLQQTSVCGVFVQVWVVWWTRLVGIRSACLIVLGERWGLSRNL